MEAFGKSFDEARDADLIDHFRELACARAAHELDRAGISLDQGPRALERFRLAAAHHRENALLRARLAARDRRIDKAHAVPRRACSSSRARLAEAVVWSTSTLPFAMPASAPSLPSVTARTSSSLPTQMKTARAPARLARASPPPCRHARDPSIGLRARAVEDGDRVTLGREMARHGKAHHAETDECHLLAHCLAPPSVTVAADAPPRANSSPRGKPILARARNILKWPARVLLAIFLVAGFAIHGVWVWLHHSLPQVEGTIALPGLTHPVEVLRDRYGIPHIYAETRWDALFALGFVHAQDRLFQMDFARRVGQGRLSELLGPLGQSADKFIRTLDLAGASERALVHLPESTRTALEAYAAGVNAFLVWNKKPLPPEFTLLGYRPEAWRPADSALIIKLMALSSRAMPWRDRQRRARQGARTGRA